MDAMGAAAGAGREVWAVIALVRSTLSSTVARSTIDGTDIVYVCTYVVVLPGPQKLVTVTCSCDWCWDSAFGTDQDLEEKKNSK